MYGQPALETPLMSRCQVTSWKKFTMWEGGSVALDPGVSSMQVGAAASWGQLPMHARAPSGRLQAPALRRATA